MLIINQVSEKDQVRSEEPVKISAWDSKKKLAARINEKDHVRISEEDVSSTK